MTSPLQALVLACALCACAGPIDPPDGGFELWPEGTLELGLEDAGAFANFPMQVQATPGAQGGYHVAVMYRVTGQAVPTVTFEHRVTRKRDDVLVSKGTRTLTVEPVAEGQSWVTPGPVVIFICPTPVGVGAEGEALHFEVTATKGGSLLGRVEADALFGCPAGDAFCASICAG